MVGETRGRWQACNLGGDMAWTRRQSKTNITILKLKFLILGQSSLWEHDDGSQDANEHGHEHACIWWVRMCMLAWGLDLSRIIVHMHGCKLVYIHQYLNAKCSVSRWLQSVTLVGSLVHVAPTTEITLVSIKLVNIGDIQRPQTSQHISKIVSWNYVLGILFVCIFSLDGYNVHALYYGLWNRPN